MKRVRRRISACTRASVSWACWGSVRDADQDQLDPAVDVGERGAQLVRDQRDEIGFELVEVLQGQVLAFELGVGFAQAGGLLGDALLEEDVHFAEFVMGRGDLFVGLLQGGLLAFDLAQVVGGAGQGQFLAPAPDQRAQREHHREQLPVAAVEEDFARPTAAQTLLDHALKLLGWANELLEGQAQQVAACSQPVIWSRAGLTRRSSPLRLQIKVGSAMLSTRRAYC